MTGLLLQYSHLLIFGLAAMATEWRKLGMLLVGFALLNVIMTPFYMWMMRFNSELYPLIFMAIDLIGAVLVLELCRPRASNRSYKKHHWLMMVVILNLFWILHYLHFRNVMNWSTSLNANWYEITTRIAAIVQACIILPGAIRGLGDVVENVRNTARSRLRVNVFESKNIDHNQRFPDMHGCESHSQDDSHFH